MRKLQPPKNLRHTIPRCCLGCAHRVYDPVSGGPVCERDGLPRECEPEAQVCDGYKKPARWSDLMADITGL